MQRLRVNVLLQTLLTLMLCARMNNGQAMNVMVCARKILAHKGPGEFHFDSASGECNPGSNSGPVGDHLKIHKVYAKHKNKGCVRWDHYVTVSQTDTLEKKRLSRDRLKMAVKLGKQFRVSGRMNSSQSVYPVITADIAFVYGDIVCAGASYAYSGSVFYIAQYMFCSDGYSQSIETPIFVANPQPSMHVTDSPFTEMVWFVKENACYNLGFEHDATGVRVSESRKRMIDGFRNSGHSVVLYMEIPYISTIQKVVYPNTLTFTTNSSSAYVGNGLALVFPFTGNRVAYPTQKSSRLLEEHSDTGNVSKYKCDLNGPTADCKLQTDHIRTKWFVDKRWVKVYNVKHHFGSLMDLTEAVRKGQRVRVKLGHWSSEPTIVTVNDDHQLSAVFIDNFQLNAATDPLYQQWRILSTDGSMEDWNIVYDTWTLLQPNGVTQSTVRVWWYIDNANWKPLYNSVDQLEYGRLERAIENGCELRVKWRTGRVEVIYDIDPIKVGDGEMAASPKQVLPYLDLTLSPLSYASHSALIEREVIRFHPDGKVIRSVWRTGHQSCDDTVYTSQNLTWFSLDGFDRF